MAGNSSMRLLRFLSGIMVCPTPYRCLLRHHDWRDVARMLVDAWQSQETLRDPAVDRVIWGAGPPTATPNGDGERDGMKQLAP